MTIRAPSNPMISSPVKTIAVVGLLAIAIIGLLAVGLYVYLAEYLVARPIGDDTGSALAGVCADLQYEEYYRCVERSLSIANLHGLDAQSSAQRHAAAWTLGLMALSAIGLIVSAVGVFAVVLTLNVTRDMALATRIIGENQVKAYLLIEDATSVGFGTRDGPYIDLIVVNDGQSTADNCKGIARLALFRSVDEPLEPLNDNVSLFGFGRVRKGISAKTGIRLDPLDIQAHLQTLENAWAEENGTKNAALAIYGRLEYDDVFGNRNGSSFTLLIKDPREKRSRLSQAALPGETVFSVLS